MNPLVEQVISDWCTNEFYIKQAISSIMILEKKILKITNHIYQKGRLLNIISMIELNVIQSFGI